MPMAMPRFLVNHGSTIRTPVYQSSHKIIEFLGDVTYDTYTIDDAISQSHT